MDIQRHSSVLGDTVEKLSDEASYKQLFHAYRDEEALPSGEVLKEIIDLCRAILFPGYYGNARISKQTIRFHTGVNVETLHSLLSKQVYAGLCFADTSCVTCPEEKISAEAEAISEAFISTLPEIRGLLATDVEATFNGDPAAQNLGEVIFCYPGFRAIGNYRIAHDYGDGTFRDRYRYPSGREDRSSFLDRPRDGYGDRRDERDRQLRPNLSGRQLGGRETSPR